MIRNIVFDISNVLAPFRFKEFLAEKGFDASYGARPLRRLIQNEIEDRLAELYLEGAIANGDVLRLVVSGNALCVQKRNGKSYKTIKTLDDNQKK